MGFSGGIGQQGSIGGLRGHGTQTGPIPYIGFSGGFGQQICGDPAAKATQTPMMVAKIVKTFIFIESFVFFALTVKSGFVKLNEYSKGN